MPLVNQPVIQVVGSTGLPWAFAQAKFSLTGTTTPVPVYQEASLLNEHTDPVVADSQGLFPPIFFDPEDGLIRVRVIEATGDFNNPPIDVDPVNENAAITAADLSNAVIIEALGYTPVNKAGDSMTGELRLNYPAAPSLAADSVGFRGSPVVTKNANYTFALNDSGRLFQKTDASTPTWTIPPNVDEGFPIGHQLYFWVAAAGDVTLARGAAVALRSSGDNTFTDEDKTLTPGTFACATQVAENSWVLDIDAAGTSGGVTTPNVDFGVNGYVRHSNGFIDQWGRYDALTLDDAQVPITFPLEFPNACRGALANPQKDVYGSGDDLFMHVIGVPSTTQVTFAAAKASDGTIDGFYWRAWGY